MGKLTGKNALVTGAGRGIGRGIALAFAHEGADLLISSRTRSELESVAAEVKELGVRVIVQEGDIGKESDVQAIFDCYQSEFDCLDLLVNNAGAFNGGPLDELSLEDWDHVINTNLRGPFMCTQRAMQMMKPRGSGRIINIASTSGHRGRADATAYSAAKGGVLNLTRSLAIQMSPYGVRVNSITPNRVGSPVGQETIPQTGREVSNLVGRQGMPPDIAAAAVFLASDEADFIAAADLLVDGGSLAGGMPFSPPSPAAR